MTYRPVPAWQPKPLNLDSCIRKPLGVLMGAIVLTSSAIGLLSYPAQAQAVLQEQGSLQSAQQAHAFSGQAGQTVAIALNSSEFDTYVVLLDPSGREIAANDDYGRSSNSAIVFMLPESGQYQVLASSYSGQGGSYSLSVKLATPFDQAYARGIQLFSEGRLNEAAGAFSEAIQFEPSQPFPYLDRAEVSYAQGDVPSAVSSYEQAADLYERAGNSKAASDIRQHLAALQNLASP